VTRQFGEGRVGRSDPPRYLLDVLEDFLHVVGESKRYITPPGGRVDIAWIQRRKCYQVTLDFRERER
jgi:hypothetical protein